MENARSAAVIAFTRSKKRGRKMRTGPVAEVVALPTLDYVAAIKGATSNVERLVSMMAWARRKYGEDQPPVDEMINELRAIGALT